MNTYKINHTCKTILLVTLCILSATPQSAKAADDQQPQKPNGGFFASLLGRTTPSSPSLQEKQRIAEQAQALQESHNQTSEDSKAFSEALENFRATAFSSDDSGGLHLSPDSLIDLAKQKEKHNISLRKSCDDHYELLKSLFKARSLNQEGTQKLAISFLKECPVLGDNDPNQVYTQNFPNNPNPSPKKYAAGVAAVEARQAQRNAESANKRHTQSVDQAFPSLARTRDRNQWQRILKDLDTQDISIGNKKPKRPQV